jgi:hypothetical protein
VAVVALIVPPLVLRPMTDPAPLAFPLGGVVAFGAFLLRELSDVRGSLRDFTETGRYLTVRTWTGKRTLDLENLRSVRTRQIAGRAGSLTYLVVTDAAGVRMSLENRKDVELITRAVRRQQIRKNAPDVEVSRPAAEALGLRPLRRWARGLQGLASAELLLALAALCIAVVFLLAR